MQAPGQTQAFSPFGGCHLRPPPHSAGDGGSCCVGLAALGKRLAIGDKTSTDYEGRLNSPSPAPHEQFPFAFKGSVHPAGAQRRPLFFGAGLALGPPGSPVRAIVFAAVLPLDFEQARGW